MDSSAHFNFEHSPAESNIESFASTPVSFCPSLFDNTMNPIEVLTPQSFDDECFFGNITDNTPMEKKPVKKRKSWGQQLPEPKTNLPPRKRAKTEDEKEQRRVERVLRNRRAAQSSRERKRQEVEALEAEKQAIERKNLDLEMRLADMEAKYHLLQQELERFGGSAIRSFSVSTPPQSDIRASSPITFSQKLFASSSETPSSMTTRTISSGVPETVDPASLSPEIRPVASSSNAKSSDLTQHPAVSVGNNSALEKFEAYTFDENFSSISGDLSYNDFRNFFEPPHPNRPDNDLFEEGIAPLADTFHSELDHMDGHHNGVFDEFVLCDFLNDEPSTTEIQCPNKLAETTASLQPQFGASSYGCDDGGNAVSV